VLPGGVEAFGVVNSVLGLKESTLRYRIRKLGISGRANAAGLTLPEIGALRRHLEQPPGLQRDRHEQAAH